MICKYCHIKMDRVKDESGKKYSKCPRCKKQVFVYYKEGAVINLTVGDLSQKGEIKI